MRAVVTMLDDELRPVGTLGRVTSLAVDRGASGKAPMLETLSIGFERDGLDFAPCWVRVDCYDQERIPLGCYWVEPDSARAEYGAFSYSATGQSVLKAAAEQLVDNGAYCLAGTDAAQFAANMLAGTVGETQVYGRCIMPRTVVFGKNASRLEAAWAALDAVGWRIRLDGDGGKHIEPLPQSIGFTVGGVQPGIAFTDQIAYKRAYDGDSRPLDMAYANLPAQGVNGVLRVVSQRLTVGQGIMVDESLGGWTMIEQESIKKLAEAFGVGSSAQPTVTTGRVVSVGEGGAWVHFDGAQEPTPVQETASAVAVGDRVTVMVQGGSATVTGNLSRPSTDDQVATKAHEIASDAKSTADKTAEHFYHDGQGAHVDGSGYRNDLTSSGMELVEKSTGQKVAQFLKDAVSLLKGAFNVQAFTFVQGAGSGFVIKTGAHPERFFDLVNIAGQATKTFSSIQAEITYERQEGKLIATAELLADETGRYANVGCDQLTISNTYPILRKRVTLDNKTIAANSGTAWTQTLPAVDDMLPVSVAGHYIYNMNTFCINRCRIDGQTLSISVYNMKNSSVAMSGSSYVDVLYVHQAILDPSAAAMDE